MAWSKDNHWLGPLKVILQEDENVLRAVLGNKLFRLAAEHARPLSAVEEVRHAKILTSHGISLELENLRSGNTRFVGVSSETLPPPARDAPEVKELSLQPVSQKHPVFCQHVHLGNQMLRIYLPNGAFCKAVQDQKLASVSVEN